MARRDRDDEGERSAGDTVLDLARLSRLIRQAAHGAGLIPVQWETLRYLARANRLSNSPGALTRYLGATKGTVSQTVGLLVKKGLVVKEKRPGDVRSVTLRLTDEAHAILAADPLQTLVKDVDGLGGKTHKRLARGLAELLAKEVLRQGEASFGTCHDCRYFRSAGAGQPMTCMIDNAILDSLEITRLCIAHTAR